MKRVVGIPAAMRLWSYGCKQSVTHDFVFVLLRDNDLLLTERLIYY